MHRSGTSAAAGVFSKVGGSAPKTLMPAHQMNERGFFESSAVMDFHEELLASAGSSWDDWRKFAPAWYASQEAETFRRRGQALFESEFGESNLPVLKDPRICRFASFWLDLLKSLNATPRVIIPIRSPLEVAQSLHAAHNMPLAKGLLLWLRHVLDSEAASRTTLRSLFAWDHFLSDWRGVVDKISAEAGIVWPALSDRTALEVEQFLGAELVHQRVTPAELAGHSKIHAWTLATYEALLELARNPRSNSAIEKLNEIRELFDISSAMFGPALAEYEFSGEKETLKAKAADFEAALSAARVERDDLEVALGATRAERDDLTGRLAAALASLQEAEAQVKLFSGQVLEKDRILEASDRRAADAFSQLVNAEARLGSAERQIRRNSPWRRLLDSHARRHEVRLIRESGIFDETWYKSQYPSAANGRSAIEHFLEEGYLQGCRPNPLFDPRWYLEQYEDVRRTGMNPLVHYLRDGAREGRDPGPDFDTKYYVSANPDAQQAVNPLTHYAKYGRREGRSATPQKAPSS
jgi:hypothetical protein